MKLSVFFVLINISLISFSQEYYFDKLIEYKNFLGTSNFFMTNSKDSTYYFCGRSNENKIIGNIYDTKTLQNHFYEIKIEKQKFEYKETYKLNNSPQERNFVYIFNNKQKDSISSYISITKYRRKVKEKLKEATLEIKYLKSDETSFFPNFFFFSMFHGFFDDVNKFKLKNKVPKFITLTINDNEIINYILNKNIEINLTLNTIKPTQ
jgi:hypothetical protein